MSLHRMRWMGVSVALATTLTSGTVFAQSAGRVDRKLFGGDFSFNGLIRVETAFSTSSQTSPVNQYGDPANGVAIGRDAGNPVGLCDPFAAPALCDYGDPGTPWTTRLNDPIDPGLAGPLFGVLGIPGLTTLVTTIGGPLGNPVISSLNITNPGVNPLGVTNNLGISDTFERYVPSRDQDLNYHILRFEATPSITWDNWSLQTRIRAVYDPGDMGYADFDARDYRGINGGFDGGSSADGAPSRQFLGEPDYFGYAVDERKNPILFERSGRNYMIDLPAFFVQWTNGNVTARLGNQSVAWGQLLFFRVMDVANGLDLRRHLFIDRAIEEFADERMSAPGLRVTWQATDQIVVDTFAQQFIPTVLNNVNTTYNIVPSQFYIRDRYVENGYDNDINYGIRVKGEYGNFNLQAMATSRLNPLGSIRWSKSGVNKPLPNSNPLGLVFNQYCNALNAVARPDGFNPANGCGPQLAETAFEASPAGVFTAEEWFNYAGFIRLDALDGLNRAIDEFPAAFEILARPIGQNARAAANELDAFFMAAEGLHGHIERDYYREEVYGLGGGYVLEAEPGSILDQLIMNLEVTYAKDRTFTAIDLRQGYTVKDEYQVGFVAEKYQRFSQTMPATYMVFQYLWQKESDLAGLLLDGYGSENYVDERSNGARLNPDVPQSDNPKINQGLPGGAHYLVFAFLQPSDAYIFEYSTAALIDVQGGVLIQPAVQWKPKGNMTVNLYYNYINGNAWGDNAYKNTLSLIDFADEIGLRFGVQF